MCSCEISGPLCLSLFFSSPLFDDQSADIKFPSGDGRVFENLNLFAMLRLRPTVSEPSTLEEKPSVVYASTSSHLFLVQPLDLNQTARSLID
jgi:hypothetical protein